MALIIFEKFFPFHLRLFMGLWLPAPHKTGLFLKQKYGKFLCKVGHRDHKKEERIKLKEQVSAPCDSLKSIYVNIIRSKLQNGFTNESALLNDGILYSVFVEESFDDVKFEV